VVPWESIVPLPRTHVSLATRVNRVNRAVTGPTRPKSRIRQRQHRVKAALLDVDSTASLVLHAGVGSAMLLAVAASMSSPRGAADRGAAVPVDAVDAFEDSVRWSVMTILSLFPYFNFVSWAFAAIDSVAAVGLGARADAEEGEEATYFWLLSGLYFIPYLVEGFQLDSFTLLTIAMGAVHVYVGPSAPARLRFLGACRGESAGDSRLRTRPRTRPRTRLFSRLLTRPPTRPLLRGSCRQIERVRYYGGGPAFPTVGLLGRIRVPALQVPRVESLVGGGQRGQSGQSGQRDRRGRGNDGSEDDDPLQELVRKELSDFDRRLVSRSPHEGGGKKERKSQPGQGGVQ